MNPGGYLRAALYTIIIFIIVLGGFLMISFIRLDRQDDATEVNVTDVPFLACNFTNTGAEPITLYSVPLADPLFALADVRAGVPFVVRSIHTPTGLLLIETDRGVSGYVDPFMGLATGECDVPHVPRDETPLTDFPTVCHFTANADTTLFDDAALGASKSVLGGGEVFVLLEQSATEDRFYGEAVNGLNGWLRAEDGEIAGACGALRVVDSAVESP